MASNEEMVRALLSTGYADGRVALAMKRMDRAMFVPESERENAYEDHPLQIGKGQTISAPGVVAFMSKSLAVGEGMRVLEIGAGSGWQAAILGELVGNGGDVVSVERIPEIAELAKRNLKRAGAGNVSVIVGDGTKGFPEKAPYDRIIVTAAGPKIPPPLVGQLKEGGKMVMPVGGAFFQELLLIEKTGGELATTPIMSVVFVPLIGEHGHRD